MKKKRHFLDFRKVRTYPIRERKSKNKVKEQNKDFALSGISFREFFDAWSSLASGEKFGKVVDAVITSAKGKRPVIFCLSSQVIELGLGALIIPLLEKQIITGIALTGAGAINDFEVALIGETGEEQSGFEDGTMGMVEETGRIMNETIVAGAQQGLGIGQAIGERILKDDFPYRDYSILAKGIELGIPVTVHIAIGTDVMQQHPVTDGAALGESGYLDFQIFTNLISQLGQGGIVLNFGSETILKDVFSRAVTIVRNLGFKAKNFITVDFDNVQSGTSELQSNLSGDNYVIPGDQSLIIPLLVQALVEYWETSNAVFKD